VLAALWTPTEAEGRVGESELKTRLRFVLSKAVHGILALGSTGEFPHLGLAVRGRQWCRPAPPRVSRNWSGSFVTSIASGT
jgi:hypothetical protein